MKARVLMWIGVVVIVAGCSSPPPATRPLEGARPPQQRVSGGHWLRNHEVTGMWSGPRDQPGVISFGETSARLCVFEARDQKGDRLYVFNPYSQNYFWIDSTAVDPVASPDVRPRASRPGGQNCADALFDE